MCVYHIKATWAGFELESLLARSLEEAESLVNGTGSTEGIRGTFRRGGYKKRSGGVDHEPKTLCVDILYGGVPMKSYNFNR